MKFKPETNVMDLVEDDQDDNRIHYADYNIFRKQQGPKTYREINEQKKSFEEYA